MSPRLRPYLEYKDSGVSWVDRIPSHWNVACLKHLGTFTASGIDKLDRENETHVKMINYMDVYGNEARTLTSSRRYMRTTCAPWKATAYSLRKGDLVFTPSSETPKDIGLSALVVEDLPGTVFSYHVLRFRFHDDRVVEEFRRRLCNNMPVLEQFSAACKGTTRKILNRGDFRNAVVVLPSSDEQQEIARFLDHVDHRINRLIRAKRRLIELLNEQKQAIILRAVTRGLDLNVQLKSSGIDWLGDVPEAWEVMRVKHCAVTVSKGTTPSTEGMEIVDSGPVRFLKAENISAGAITNTPLCFVDEVTHARLRRSQLRSGDVLFVIAGATLGKTAVLTAHDVPANTNQAVAFVRPNHRVLSEFAALWLQSPRVRELTWLNAVQSAQPNLSLADLGGFAIPVPPAGEQAEILLWLRGRLAPLDLNNASTLREMELLREYRTRLIADVVTGKLDVRGVELPPLDDDGTLDEIDAPDDGDAEEMLDDESDE